MGRRRRARGHRGHWQYQGKGYQTWARADASGAFTIADVRPGSYTLYAFTDGATGEFSRTAVTVNANATTALGNLTGRSRASRARASRGKSARRIAARASSNTARITERPFFGIPTAPNFRIRSSTTRRRQRSRDRLELRTQRPRLRRRVVHLEMAHPLRSRRRPPRQRHAHHRARRRESARLDIFVNGEATKLASFYPANSGGNALIREGIHAKYSAEKISIPVSALNVGADTITLVEGRTSGATEHVIYDYLALTLPPFPPPPPDSGRSLVWKGGSNAAANTWDLGTTTSFLNGAAATAFGTGDTATFDATDERHQHHPHRRDRAARAHLHRHEKLHPRRHRRAHRPDAAGEKRRGNFEHRHRASLRRTHDHQRRANYFHQRRGECGRPRRERDHLHRRRARHVFEFQHLQRRLVESRRAHRLHRHAYCDARCNLHGELNGGGAFSCYVPDIRTEFDGDWSGFSGQLNVTTDSGGGDFRIGRDYAPPGFSNAAVNLGNKVTMYYVGTLNSGNGTTIPIGELTSTNTTGVLRGGVTGGAASPIASVEEAPPSPTAAASPSRPDHRSRRTSSRPAPAFGRSPGR